MVFFFCQWGETVDTWSQAVWQSQPEAAATTAAVATAWRIDKLSAVFLVRARACVCVCNAHSDGARVWLDLTKSQYIVDYIFLYLKKKMKTNVNPVASV